MWHHGGVNGIWIGQNHEYPIIQRTQLSTPARWPLVSIRCLCIAIYSDLSKTPRIKYLNYYREICFECHRTLKALIGALFNSTGTVRIAVVAFALYKPLEGWYLIQLSSGTSSNFPITVCKPFYLSTLCEHSGIKNQDDLPLHN
jgi:hypothetical protein